MPDDRTAASSPGRSAACVTPPRSGGVPLDEIAYFEFVGCGDGPTPGSLRGLPRRLNDPDRSVAELLELAADDFRHGASLDPEVGYERLYPLEPRHTGVELVDDVAVVSLFPSVLHEVESFGDEEVMTRFVDGLRATLLQFDGVSSLRFEMRGSCFELPPLGTCEFGPVELPPDALPDPSSRRPGEDLVNLGPYPDGVVPIAVAEAAGDLDFSGVETRRSAGGTEYVVRHRLVRGNGPSPSIEITARVDDEPLAVLPGEVARGYERWFAGGGGEVSSGDGWTRAAWDAAPGVRVEVTATRGDVRRAEVAAVARAVDAFGRLGTDADGWTVPVTWDRYTPPVVDLGPPGPSLPADVDGDGTADRVTVRAPVRDGDPFMSRPALVAAALADGATVRGRIDEVSLEPAILASADLGDDAREEVFVTVGGMTASNLVIVGLDDAGTRLEVLDVPDDDRGHLVVADGMGYSNSAECLPDGSLEAMSWSAHDGTDLRDPVGSVHWRRYERGEGTLVLVDEARFDDVQGWVTGGLGCPDTVGPGT